MDHPAATEVVRFRGRMKGRMRFLAALLATSTVAAQSFAADAEHGAQVARRWCASCHVTGSGQSDPRTEAPSFAQIARLPNFDANRLAFFLLDPHPKMPNMYLSRAEAAALAAYIGSLSK